MRPDIVYRLRDEAERIRRGTASNALYGLLREAAQEIERLKSEIERLKKNDK